ncbi:MAG: hypothetical protein R3D28_20715 [Geminicoccaceae bacterium]
MKTTAVTPADLAASVLAVPPLPLAADLSPNEREMRRLVGHIDAGGVSTILWGGNAQLQHWPASRYSEFLARRGDGGRASWADPRSARLRQAHGRGAEPRRHPLSCAICCCRWRRITRRRVSPAARAMPPSRLPASPPSSTSARPATSHRMRWGRWSPRARPAR